MEQLGAATAPEVEGAAATLSSLETLIEARGADEAPPVELASLHFTAAQIYLAQPEPGAKEHALEHLWAGWRLQPQDMDIRLVLSRCLEEQAKLTDLAELYQRSAEQCEETQEQNALLARAAEIYHRRGDLEEELQVFRRMADYGGHRVVEERVRALRALIQTLGPDRAPLRVQALDLLLGHLRGSERFDCAMELARARHEAGDEEAAYAAYQQALALRPDAEAALEPAVAYLQARQELGDVVRLLSLAVQAIEEPGRRAVLLRRLARLFEEKLSNPAQAAELWWHAWDEEESGEELPALKRLYSQLQHWEAYLEVLRREVQRARAAEEKLEALRELAAFQREVLHDHRAAADTLGFVLQLAPDDPAALAGRVELFEKEGMEQAAAAALRRFADKCEGPKRSELLRRLARLESRRPNRGNLLDVLRRLDPQDVEDRALVAESRAELSAEHERGLMVQTGLLQLSMARQGSEPAGVWVGMALELARYCLQAGEPGHAADCLRQVLEVEPENKSAVELRAELAPREQGGDASLEQLTARAEQLIAEHPLAAVRLFVQAADVARDRLGDDEGQVQAAELLRRAAACCPPEADAELSILEEALRAAALNSDLVELLRRRAESGVAPAMRKALLLSLAQLLRDRLREPERAVAVLEEALALDPLDTEVAEAIRALHTQLGNHAALARVLEELLAGASGDARVPILEELGRLYTGELHDPGLALNRYGELLALRPDHPQALAVCRAHDEEAGDFRSVAVLLCRAAEAAEDPLPRAELHREIALIAERRLEDLDFAIAQWRRVVELWAADAAPRAELRRLLRLAGRWGELETLLLSDISRTVRPEDKVPLYLELATLAREHLEDERQAAGYLRLAQQIAPASRELLGQLEAVYERLGHWRELAATLQRHAELEPDVAEKVKLLHRAARVLQMRLKREDEALEISRKVRQLQRGHRASAALIAEIFTRRSQWPEKIGLLEEQAGIETDAAELSRIHLELGHLIAERLGDSSGAALHFEKAMELDGGRGEVLPALRRFYEAQGRWDQLVELIRRRASSDTLSSKERAAALCEIGRIREVHQHDADAARDAYDRALHIEPSCVAALTGLRDLARQRGQWREVVNLGRREIEAVGEASARCTILLEIAEVLHEKLDRSSAAAEALEAVLAENPGNLQAAVRLAAISFQAEDWDRAARLLRQVVESEAEVDKLHECYYRLGYASERLGEEEEAFSFYVKSFGREPLYLPTLDRLFELCYARRQWDNTLRIASAIVSTHEKQKTPQQLAELHLRIGLCELQLAERDIAVTKLQDMVLEPGEVPSAPDEAWLDVAESWAATALNPHLLGRIPRDTLSRAVRAMDRVLAHASNHPDALQVLSALSLAVGEWERSLRYIERLVDAGGLPKRRLAALLVCAGDVALHHLGSPQRGESYYRRAFSFEPSLGRAQRRLSALGGEVAQGSPQKERAVRGGLRHTRTQPLPFPRMMPPLPAGARTDPRPFRPAPRSKPRKPDDE